MQTEFRVIKEAAIEKVAKELLANVYKEKKKQEIADELYQEEQRSKWTKESVRPVLKKQCDIAESFQEMVMPVINYVKYLQSARKIIKLH